MNVFIFCDDSIEKSETNPKLLGDNHSPIQIPEAPAEITKYLTN